MNRCLCCNKPLKEGTWHKNCIRRFFNSDYLPEINITNDQLKQLAITQLEGKKGLAGVQEKLSLHLDLNNKKRPRLTIIGFPSGYILKPQSSTYKQLPEYEHTAMLLADLCHIPVVPHALIHINDSELAYITKRVDRKGNHKIHMEDFCQAIGNLTDNKYRASYEDCMRLIDEHSFIPELDKRLLFTALYFSFVICNSDFHLKNMSFIMDEYGCLSLAPFYDFLPTKVILPTDHDDLGMVFNGRKTNLHKHDFDQFCKNIGIDEKTQSRLMKSIDDKENEMIEIINSSSINQYGKSEWIRKIHSNIKRAKQP